MLTMRESNICVLSLVCADNLYRLYLFILTVVEKHGGCEDLSYVGKVVGGGDPISI